MKDALASFAGLVRSGAWIALGLIAQAATLQLVEAGPVVRYQHYAPLAAMLSTDRVIFLAILCVQATVVAIVLARRWPAMRVWLLTTFTPRKVVSIALLFGFSSATFSRSPSAYASELIFATLIQLIALISVVMAAINLPPNLLESLWRRSVRVLGDEASDPAPVPGKADRFAIVLAIMVSAVSAVLSVVSYERHPHIPDEVAYLLNAKYFAAGMLYMPPPPVPAAFDVDLMQLTATQWFSSMPPGWPAILALGARLDAAWLVNPLLAGVNIILVYLFLRELYPRRIARLSLILLCLSPWYVFMGMNFMSHMFSLTAALCAALTVARVIRTGRLRWALIGGAALGVLSLTRPLEALLMAMLLAVWTMTARTPGNRLVSTAALATASLAVGALTIPYNRALTGSATEFPLAAYVGTHFPPGSNDLGFGRNRGWGWTGLDPRPGHDLLDVFINAGLNLFAVNVELLGWATGSLIFILLLFSRKLESSDYKMLAAIFGVAAIQSLYWFSGGPDFGARYWFLMIVPLVALVARGIDSNHANGTQQGTSFPAARARSLAVALILCGMSAATFFPWRAIDKYYHYRGMRPDIRELASRYKYGRSLVLIRGKRHPDFASAAVYNPVSLTADAPVYAWSRNQQIDAETRAAFSDRPVWLIDGPSLTGRGFIIVAIP